jgi:type IV secretory pathway VirD2 relaxase
MARIVRHHGRRFRSALLSEHVAYLKREGVTRDSQDALGRQQGVCGALRGRSASIPFRRGAGGCPRDGRSSRIHARADAERDLDTKLDWIAADHWNSDNPHVHVLIRGRAEDGTDLVISRA